MPVTVIRNASVVVAWNPARERHEYLTGADVAFDGDRIAFVGRGYEGPAERVIAGAERMVLPGFVNIHSHPTSEPLNRGLLEEKGSPRLGMSSLYEFMPLIQADDEVRRAAAQFAIAELLRSGVTTFTDYSGPRSQWIEDAAASGIRTCLAPSFRSGRWFTRDGHSVDYEWDEARGRQAMAEALDLVDRANAHPSGRLMGMVAPGQVDTCTAELLQEAAAAAEARNLPLQIHAAQSVVEFREMARRHGKTPIEWLAEIGFLGPRTIIGHCIFIDEHPWIRWPYRGDLERMARSGARVAHCPNIFARRGILLRDFGRYRAMGIEIGLGTDTFPHNFVDEMRWATVLCKLAADNVEATSLGEVFRAATIGGATALGRDDLGRLAPGAKADLAVVDLAHPSLQPVYDPLRSLVFSGLERPISDVFVDGRQVVEDGRVTTIDIAAATETVIAGQKRALARVAEHDWAGRDAESLFPPTLPRA